MSDKIDFVGHQKFLVDDLNGETPPINNFIIKAESAEDKWIESTTEAIAIWRSHFRSSYIRWALTINGLDKAKDRYDSKKGDELGFTIESIRANGMERIALWDMQTAAKNHKSTIPMIASWGIVDLYSCLEEFVFEIYIIFLNHYPDSIIKGNEFRNLRQLKRVSSNDADKKKEWEELWRKRVESWQKKRIYDGLNKVFLAYTKVSGLKTPSIYKVSTVETWAETIAGIAELRNCFTHGVDTVNKALAEFSNKPHSMLFDFREGEKLTIELKHLQSIECFLDQFLTTINFSLMERAGYELQKQS
jgi:hypothetical protein